jgi:hypothetical protein
MHKTIWDKLSQAIYRKHGPGLDPGELPRGQKNGGVRSLE